MAQRLDFRQHPSVAVRSLAGSVQLDHRRRPSKPPSTFDDEAGRPAWLTTTHADLIRGAWLPADA